MTRSMTAAAADALEAVRQAPRFLVQIDFDSGPLRLWSGVGPLSALGETWTGVGRLGSIGPVREGRDPTARGIVMELTIVPTPEVPDAPDAVLNIAEAEDYQGRPATVYQAMLDPDTGALIEDPFARFRGYLDTMDESEEPGRATIRIRAENRLIDLERPRLAHYTPEDQKARYPGDTFFDEVAGLQQRQIVLKERG